MTGRAVGAAAPVLWAEALADELAPDAADEALLRAELSADEMLSDTDASSELMLAPALPVAVAAAEVRDARLEEPADSSELRTELTSLAMLDATPVGSTELRTEETSPPTEDRMEESC
jgi:hypothetical protein